MNLETYTNGSGERTAILVHGAAADHGTWHAVESALIERGHRVVSVDMRGHGRSPRGDYSLAALGDDLVDSLPVGADLAIGHSMGGLALSLAVERLAPAHAVYVDPAFRLPPMPADAGERMRRVFATADAAHVRAMNPRWNDLDVARELAGFAACDPEFYTFVAEEVAGRDLLPDEPHVPSLVLHAENTITIDARTADELADRGFDVRMVPNAAHCIHRDDLPGLLAELDSWVRVAAT
ncbi:alpha/beta hydrolase [Nocardiopsis sp. N85]|uniref:alpha/beta fold hydrolase n=1 Tax=Nocardiopsis sp. N85 TaxID=3029400 RepID=UPI00237FB96D|nr:alpha/beta hydrolase [Nocardiopsis sp. N85]MDE3721707.1 alpha/beta hydrolase [Nocardiopsis sp. N85]